MHPDELEDLDIEDISVPDPVTSPGTKPRGSRKAAEEDAPGTAPKPGSKPPATPASRTPPRPGSKPPPATASKGTAGAASGASRRSAPATPQKGAPKTPPGPGSRPPARVAAGEGPRTGPEESPAAGWEPNEGAGTGERPRDREAAARPAKGESRLVDSYVPADETTRTQLLVVTGLFAGIFALSWIAVSLDLFGPKATGPGEGDVLAIGDVEPPFDPEEAERAEAIAAAQVTASGDLLRNVTSDLLAEATEGLPPAAEDPSSMAIREPTRIYDDLLFYGDLGKTGQEPSVGSGSESAGEPPAPPEAPAPAPPPSSAKADPDSPPAPAASKTPSPPKPAAPPRPSSAPPRTAAAPRTSSPPPTVRNAGDALNAMKQARRQLQSGDPGGALQAYQAVLAAQPGNVTARMGLALASYELNRLGDAKAALRQVLEGSPTHGRALLLMASIAQEEGRKAEAVDHYRRFLAATPSGPQAEEVRAILERIEGD